MGSTSAALVMVLALAGGCDLASPLGGEPARPSTRAVAPPPRMPDDHPDPEACEAATDCIASQPLPQPNPCCDGYPFAVHSRAYAEWRQRWVSQRCAGQVCEPLPSPAMPTDCVFEARCVAGRCVDACEP